MEFKAPRIIIYFLYVLIFGQVALCENDFTATSAPDVSVLTDEASARQLRIYREALLQGSSEDIRMEAAVGLLLQNTPGSRNVLLSALKSEENLSAQEAVCKALVNSRGLSEKIDSIDVFRGPLLEILSYQSSEQAMPAAEALLLYDFQDLSESLDAILSDGELSAKQRINAIYALQLRPEPLALRDLIKLLDDPDPEVSKAAETALQEAFGIPVGTSRQVWSDILIELKLKSPEEIRKDRLLRQEMKLREVQTERDRWQKMYLISLDKQYELLDEAGRGEEIQDMLNSDLYMLRIWALDKAAMFPVIGEELREGLLLLLSDSSREVRLQAAKVFSNMSALNPAETLLEQFKYEKDAEVRLAVFEALGKAVFFAFLPDSPIDLPKDIKTETLSIALDYLNSDSEEAVVIGAEAASKIIELNNLGDKLLKSHLTLLLGRYNQSVLQGEEIQGELLSILARLCGQGGAKDVACRLYEPLFIEAITVGDNPELRLPAAQGLTYVDKVKALALFKEYDLMKDDSLAVRHVVVDLAGQTGESSDLPWLVDLLSDNGQQETAWLAILSICQRQEPAFLMDWLNTLESAPGTKDEYIREILDIAELKAIGKMDSKQLIAIRERTIQWFQRRKAWDDGANYLEQIDYPSLMDSFSQAVQEGSLEILLASGTPQELSQVVENKLVKGFSADDPTWGKLEQYFQNSEVSETNKRDLFEMLDSFDLINSSDWDAFLDIFRADFDIPDPNATEGNKKEP